MLKMRESTDILVDIMSDTTAAARQEGIEFEEAFTLHHRTVFRAAVRGLKPMATVVDSLRDTGGEEPQVPPTPGALPARLGTTM